MENKGLTTAEVLERAKNGKNVLTQGKKKSLFIAFTGYNSLSLLKVLQESIPYFIREIDYGVITAFSVNIKPGS